MKNGTKNTPHLGDITNILSFGSQNRPKISAALAARGVDIPRTTLIRLLGQLIREGQVVTQGAGRATIYSLPAFNPLLAPAQSRDITRDYHFNPNIFSSCHDLIPQSDLPPMASLAQARSLLPEPIYQKERERYLIDLSWKSSSIEGNTYSHFDTVHLLTTGQPARDKTSYETQMILNHKAAIEYILEHPPVAHHLSLEYILHVHSLLVQNLGVSKELRSHPVGISGTTYTPPHTRRELERYLPEIITIINEAPTPVESALLTLALLSYLQPFEDGNKRTARLIGNAILIGHDILPPSYFDISERDYLQVVILFYEQNTIIPLKDLFLRSLKYTTEHYFLIR